MGKSLVRLTAVDAGFDYHHVLTLTPVLAGTRDATPEATLRYYRQVVERVRALPGVLGAAMVTNVPMSHTEETKFRIEGQSASNYVDAPSCEVYWVSPDYFRVLRILLRRGRFFTDQDGLGGIQTALVSENFAKVYVAGSDPVGQRVQLGSQNERGPWLEIVGIVGDVRQSGLDSDPSLAVYLPQAAYPFHYTRLVA